MSIVVRIHHSITTAMNDDMSEAQTEKRTRFTARITVMFDAIEEIERLHRMAYKPSTQHADGCDCIQCVPI